MSDGGCCLLPSDGGCCYQYRRLEFPCRLSVCLSVAVVNTGCWSCRVRWSVYSHHCQRWKLPCPIVCAACCRVRWSVYSHYCQRWKLPCPIVCVGCCPLMVGAVVNTGGRGVAHLPVWCECRCPMVGAACCPLMVGAAINTGCLSVGVRWLVLPVAVSDGRCTVIIASGGSCRVR